MREIKPGSQCERILEYLKKYGRITQSDCSSMHPPILRLASRISDLQKLHGVKIIAKRTAHYNEDGIETSHWTTYILPTQEELEHGI